MKRGVLLAASFAVVAGCATVSQMTATGGSRSDGIVKLSYEVGMFDKVAIDEATSLDTARRRCATWGYGDAEAFGGHTRQCQQAGSMGCLRWFVTKEYQCIATASATYSRSNPPLQSTVGMPDLDNSAPASRRTSAIKLVPARTRSGYCIEAPPDYQGTGSASAPAVTDAMPRC